MESQWIRSHAVAQFEAPAMLAPEVGGKTVRAAVTLGLGGNALRLILGQHYGSAITYGSVKLALHGEILPVSFHGKPSVTIENGQQIISDPLPVSVRAGDTVTLWMYAATGTLAQTACIVSACHSPAGDFTGVDFTPEPAAGPFGDMEQCCGYCGIDVLSVPPRRVIALIGDSVSAMELWTKPVQEQLVTAGAHTVLLNMGICGNRLLSPSHIPAFRNAQFFGESGLDRLERDGLALPGVTCVAFALGVNDISQPGGDTPMSPPAEERCSTASLIAGLEEAVRRCRQNGLEVIGCTITPFGGYVTGNDTTYRIRSEVNDWIRHSGAFDRVVDFAAVVSDGQKPDFYLPAYDSGDHLHPSAEGGQVMAEAFLRCL